LVTLTKSVKGLLTAFSVMSNSLAISACEGRSGSSMSIFFI